MRMLIIMLIATALLPGCIAAERPVAEVKHVPVVEPMESYLIPIQDEVWKDKYGEGTASLVAYNLVVLRLDQKTIFNYITSMHPPVDPNAVSIESRVKALEERSAAPSTKIDWLFDSEGLSEWKAKINQLIDEVNK